MKKYQKRTDYSIKYEFAEIGKRVHNFLENVDYVTEENHNMILTGTVGEQWVTSLENVLKTYNFDRDPDTLQYGDTGIIHPKASGNIVHAEPATEITEITTSWGTKLTAKIGDIIAYNDDGNGKPNYNKGRVIDKEVFVNTYEEV